MKERRASLVLGPASFVVDPADPDTARPADIPHWRARPSEYLDWRRALTARAARADALEGIYRRIVETVEAQALPALRDALITELAAPHELPEAAADRLTRELLIDLRAITGPRTTRVDHALETLQGVLFSTRAGRLAIGPGSHWTIGVEATSEYEFDREWRWMGSFGSWLAATRVFAYPESQLFPALYSDDPPLAPPTEPFRQLIATLREHTRPTPEDARAVADRYLTELRKPDSGVPLERQLRLPPPPQQQPFVITDQRTDDDLVTLQRLSRDIFDPAAQHQREIFWLVPMALAAKLQEAGQFATALDWYQRAYAYHLPQANRKIYHGLTVEEDTDSNYDRVPEWTIAELNPHVFAIERRNCYTRATIMAIAGCFNAFADAEFARNTVTANARARMLYETAADLLDLPEGRAETGPNIPFPANPVQESLVQHARASLTKIHTASTSPAPRPSARPTGRSRCCPASTATRPDRTCQEPRRHRPAGRGRLSSRAGAARRRDLRRAARPARPAPSPDQR